MEAGTSWLCPTPNDRERFLEMHERLRVARISTIAAAVVIAAALAMESGWKVLAIGALMLVIVAAGGARLDRRRRPELWIFYTTVLNIQVVLAIGVVMTGGPRSALTAMLAVPVLMLGSRFSNRGLVVGAPISALFILGTTAGVDPGYVLDHPSPWPCRLRSCSPAPST